MIATFVNCIAVLVGSLAGLLLHRKIGDSFRKVVFLSIGLISLLIGIKMALETQRIVFLALSLVGGGLLGTWWRVEDGILAVGEFLGRSVKADGGDGKRTFALGFLNASVLFCVGAMTLVGSFQAGVQGNYDLIFTKSVMDGFMAVLLTAAMGVGVAFSAVAILVYQGGLTLLSTLLSPYVSDLLLSEISGVGGVLVMMIGLNLLELKTIKTADFLPGILIVIAFVLAEGPVRNILGIG